MSNLLGFSLLESGASASRCAQCDASCVALLSPIGLTGWACGGKPVRSQDSATAFGYSHPWWETICRSGWCCKRLTGVGSALAAITVVLKKTLLCSPKVGLVGGSSIVRCPALARAAGFRVGSCARPPPALSPILWSSWFCQASARLSPLWRPRFCRLRRRERVVQLSASGQLVSALASRYLTDGAFRVRPPASLLARGSQMLLPAPQRLRC